MTSSRCQASDTGSAASGSQWCWAGNRRNGDVALPPGRDVLKDRRPQQSRVAIIPAGEYSERLGEILLSGLRLFRFKLQGKSVLLKPNPVEYIAGAEVNANPLLVGAAAEAFLKLGAERVVVGEGPVHQRDTYLVLAESGLDVQLRSRKISFVDLNRDELFKCQREPTIRDSTTCGFQGLSSPRTSLSRCRRSRPTIGPASHSA